MVYLVDSDVFIQAKNAHYGFDFCPGFWDWIEQAHASGVIASVEKVGEELKRGHDELASWATAQSGLFLVPDQSVAQSLARVSVWAAGAGYRAGAVNTFLASGDYFLIAHAHAHACTVVTHEVSAPDSQKKVKIPDACNGVGVNSVRPWDMLRAEKVCLRL